MSEERRNSMGLDMGIAAAAMSMQAAALQSSYSNAILKKNMDTMEQQAMSLINDMMQAVPAPSEYTFDVRA